MGTPERFAPDVRERAVRMVLDGQGAHVLEDSGIGLASFLTYSQ